MSIFSLIPKNEDIALAQYYNNIGHEDNFLLPLSMEARAELDNLQEIMGGITLEPMGTYEWILCWGDTDFEPKKFYNFMSEILWRHNASPPFGKQSVS